MPENRTTGQSRGFALVEFDARHSVIRGLEYDQPLAINGSRFFPQEFKAQDGRRRYKRRVSIVVIQSRRGINPWSTCGGLSLQQEQRCQAKIAIDF